MHLLRIVALLVIAPIAITACSAKNDGSETGGTAPEAGESAPSTQAPPQVALANELAVIVRLRTIASAEVMYYAESVRYATVEELTAKRLLTDPSDGKLRGYSIELRLKPSGFEATAVPNKYGVTGRRSFYIDETNVLRGGDKRGAPATSDDPEQ